jgi:hypothetical protein
VPDGDLDEATARSEQRRRLAEQRADEARRRATVARTNAEAARSQGNGRAAAVHEHEAVIHQRAVEIHLQAVRLQQQHTGELMELSPRKGGVDDGSLRRIMANVRRAREDAELRSEQARTFALKARERATQLQTRRQSGARDA